MLIKNLKINVFSFVFLFLKNVVAKFNESNWVNHYMPVSNPLLNSGICELTVVFG